MRPDTAAEMLARLTAKVATWEPVIQEFGAISRDDIALALALVKSMPARLIARMKYMDQVEYASAFEEKLLEAIERGALHLVVDHLAAPEKWRIPRAGFIRDLCRLALAETLDPRKCPVCKGRGFLMKRKNRLRVICDDITGCGGNGIGSYTGRYRASLMGVSEDAWRHSWREKYSAIQAVIDRFEGIALGGIAKRFSR